MPSGSKTASPREEAQRRAYRLTHELQAGVEGATESLEALLAPAEREGWPEVVRAVVFGRVIAAWLAQSPSTAALLDELIERSIADNAPLMLAVGLGLRSDTGFSGHDPSAADSRDADLARAVVLLEQHTGDPLELISAHTACAIAFGNRWLFELGDQQYAAALAVGHRYPSGSLDFLLAPITFNIAESQLSWASMLRQAGDHEGVRDRLASWDAVSEATARYEMPDSWKEEHAAHGLLLAAIAGKDTADEARRRIVDVNPDDHVARRRVGLLTLAIVMADAATGRAVQSEVLERAIDLLSPHVHPHVYDLALSVAAEIEARHGTGAGLRYGRRQFGERWANRTTSLGTMLARIATERSSSERDVLTKYAQLDDLTGAGNRRALEAYIAEASRRDIHAISLILLDLDAFKAINDSFGHLAGDAVLVGIARVLTSRIRTSDIVVRLGGDEFAVVLAETDGDDVLARAIDILEHVDRTTFDDEAAQLQASLSAGIATGRPAELGRLLALADSALYRAKAGEGVPVGRSRIVQVS